MPVAEAEMADGRNDGRGDERMDGRMDRRMDRRMEGLMDRPRMPDMDRPVLDRDLFYIRCGGLPYGCTKEDLVRFFTPYEIARNGKIYFGCVFCLIWFFSSIEFLFFLFFFLYEADILS